jgi:hypothetical protein
MSEVTISVSDALNATLEARANAAGFGSKQEYLLALVQADWKQRVRDAAQRRG